MERFIITDWAGNVLNFKGKFERPQFAVAMQFTAFEDGWAWIYENISGDDSAYDDVFVEVLS